MFTALLGALAIGISLGILGSGGSILTLPILLFILQRPEKQAIAESLAIVGCVALIGAIPYMLRMQVHWNSVLWFGLPGICGAYLGGWGSYYVNGWIQLKIFALIMLVVASTMLFGPPSFDKFCSYWRRLVWLNILEGFLIGCLTGFIGIGGGFLIVPTLVILSNLTMSFAVGTSLIIIAINSFIGFLEQLFTLNTLHLNIDWEVIVIVSAVGIFGSFSGGLISDWFSQACLRKVFGLSVLTLGFYLLIT